MHKLLLVGLLVISQFSFGQELLKQFTYYHNSDKIETVYHVLKKKKSKKHGEFLVLNKDSTINIKGWYSNDLMDSTWKYFNPEGTLMVKGQFKDDKKVGEWKYYRENKIIESKGYYKNGKEEGHWYFYNEFGNLICEGNFKNGDEIEESFQYYDTNNNIIDSLRFVNDTLIQAKCRTIVDLNKSAYYGYPEPHFRLGKDALVWYYNINIKVPGSFRAQETSGSAKVIFYVKPNGKVKILKFIGSFSEKYDEAMIKLLTSMPRWIPATKNGNPINSIYIMPFSYNYGGIRYF